MSPIYTSKPENKSGIILLLMSILTIIIVVIIILSETEILYEIEKTSDIAIACSVLLLVCCWAVFLMDEAIWQICGEERCECNNDGIIITKRRMINRRKVIYWGEITNISFYNPNSIWKTVTFLTVAGVTQDTILIRYGNNKKYRMGTNLKRTQAIKVVKEVLQYKDFYNGKQNTNN